MSRYLVFRALNVCLFALLTLFCLNLAVPLTAFAQAKKAIAVGLIEGPQGDKARKSLLKTLKKTKEYEITDAEDLRPGAGKNAYSTMAQALQVDAILVGKVSRGQDLTLSVIGPDGNLIEDVKLKGGSAPKLQKAIDTEAEPAIAGVLGAKKAAEPPPEDEEEEAPPGAGAAAATTATGGDSEEDEEDESSGAETGGQAVEEADSEPAERGRRPLELLVGFRLYSRSFTYQDALTASLFPYKLAIAPSIVAAARIYPLAFFRDDALANLGIMAKLDVGIGTTTNYNQPQLDGSTVTYQLNNGTSEWQAGLRGRLPLGESELGIFGLYGAHSFVLVGDEGTTGTTVRPDPLVPDVDYHFLRTGFDARLRVRALSVGGHFGARFLTSMKNIDQEYWWFPGATGSGIDFGAFAAYQVLSFMDVAVGADYIRYGFDFNGIPDDTGLPGSPAQKIAGGATDTYLSGWGGLIFHFDGKSKVEGGAVSVEATPSAPPVEEEPDEEE